jgi:hypothetical protein
VPDFGEGRQQRQHEQDREAEEHHRVQPDPHRVHDLYTFDGWMLACCCCLLVLLLVPAFRYFRTALLSRQEEANDREGGGNRARRTRRTRGSMVLLLLLLLSLDVVVVRAIGATWSKGLYSLEYSNSTYSKILISKSYGASYWCSYCRWLRPDFNLFSGEGRVNPCTLPSMTAPTRER